MPGAAQTLKGRVARLTEGSGWSAWVGAREGCCDAGAAVCCAAGWAAGTGGRSARAAARKPASSGSCVAGAPRRSSSKPRCRSPSIASQEGPSLSRSAPSARPASQITCTRAVGQQAGAAGSRDRPWFSVLYFFTAPLQPHIGSQISLNGPKGGGRSAGWVRAREHGSKPLPAPSLVPTSAARRRCPPSAATCPLAHLLAGGGRRLWEQGPRPQGVLGLGYLQDFGGSQL